GAGEWRGDAGRRRKGERQTFERAHREIGEGLRLERVGRPADGAGGLDRRRREALSQHSHQGPITSAAAGDDPSRRRARQHGDGASDRSGRDGRERCSPILRALARKPAFLRYPVTEGITIERFWGRLGKEWMRQHALNRSLVDGAGSRGSSLVILRLTAAQTQEIVDQRVAGSGIAG